MVTREILLSNEFEFRAWDEDSTYPGLVNWSPEGEYTRRLDGDKIITIGYSKLFKWNFEIMNIGSHIRFTGDCQDAISIDSLQQMLDLAGIKLKLNRGEDVGKDWTNFT